MYVEVHKQGDKWFRNDNGALVGTEASLKIARHQKFYKRLNNDCIILVVDAYNDYKSVFKGFLQKNGDLFRDKTSEKRYFFVLD